MRYCWVVLILIMIGSCIKIGPYEIGPKPIPDVLPPITKEGLGTCGYIVDGTIVEFKRYFSISSKTRATLNLEYDSSSGKIRLFCLRYPHVLVIERDSVFGVGSYKLRTKESVNFSQSAMGGYSFRDDNLPRNLDHKFKGELDVLRFDTLDSGELIVSATFSFTSYNVSNTDSANIVQGRFDVREGRNVF